MGVRDGLGPTAHTELAVERGQAVLQSAGHDPKSLAICAMDFGQSIANSSDCSAEVSSVPKSGSTRKVSGKSSSRLCNSAAVTPLEPEDAPLPKDRARACHP